MPSRRGGRAGLTFVSLAAVAFAVLLVLPVGTWALWPLENEYPRTPLPARVDGILVLGGGLDAGISLSRGAPSEDPAAGRLIGAVALARRYPKARLVFAGGSGALIERAPPEASAARMLFDALGVARPRVTYEARSRNTFENLKFAQRLVLPRAGETWVLATSASQLPRAMAIARALGWKLIAWPTDYRTPAAPPVLSGADLVGNLEALEMALHEWLGLAVERVSGRR